MKGKKGKAKELRARREREGQGGKQNRSKQNIKRERRGEAGKDKGKGRDTYKIQKKNITETQILKRGMGKGKGKEG